jgi:hypothetical protein
MNCYGKDKYAQGFRMFIWCETTYVNGADLNSFRANCNFSFTLLSSLDYSALCY